jgi:hypothetical protein
MSEQLTKFFTAASRYRRSERSLVRSVAVVELEQLRGEVTHPKLQSRISEVLNEAYMEKAKAS